MKEISIQHKGVERKFQYQVFGDCDYDGSWYFTEFYDGVETIEYKKYWLFGETLTKTEPKFVFGLEFNIESPTRTKEEVRAMIVRKLDILGRKEEIAKGELI